jgi:hypothetical protein
MHPDYSSLAYFGKLGRFFLTIVLSVETHSLTIARLGFDWSAST